MTATVKRAKTETLSLRLDPKTKFMLDFLARIQGQSITTVVERAVKETAGRTGISAGFGNDDKIWNMYWDVSEGIRTLKLLIDSDYPANYEEDEILQFTKNHWEFFYTTERATTPRRGYVDILWPEIENYLSIWRDQRQTNYWAAGEKMKEDLLAARVAPPEWPKAAKTFEPKGPRESFSADLDDEIPF